MRIRCRSINYETLALDAEATEASQYEFLSHVQQNNNLKDPLNDNENKTYFEILGSAIPTDLFYLRPIPVQPAFDAFEAQITSIASSSATRSNGFNLSNIVSRHETSFKFDGTVRGEKDWECDGFLLKFSQDLEDEAIALRKQSDELLPQLLKHVGNQVLPNCNSHISDKGNIRCGQWNRLLRKSGDSYCRQKYDVGECKWQTWKGKIIGWDEISAVKELSSLLLERIHKLQHLDFEYKEEAINCQDGEMDYIAFRDWLEERKERWKSERFYRRSMTIVQENQIYNRLTMGENDNRQYKTKLALHVINETDFFLRTDPVVPKIEQNVPKCPSNAYIAPINFRYVTMSPSSNKSNEQWLASHRSKWQGSWPKKKFGKNKENVRDAKRSWLDSIASPENTLGNLLQKYSPLLNTTTIEDSEMRENCIDIKIELPASHLPSDLQLPGRCLRQDTAATIDTYLSGMILSLWKANTPMISKRRRCSEETSDELKLIKPSNSSIMSSVNGVYLRSISTLVSPFQATNRIFLPHVRNVASPQILFCQPRKLFSSSVQSIVSGGDKLKPFFRSNRNPNAIISTHFGRNKWKQDIRNCDAYVVRLDNAKITDNSEKKIEFINDLHASYEQSLSDTVVIRGEFIHLSMKSRSMLTAQLPRAYIQAGSSQMLEHSELHSNECSLEYAVKPHPTAKEENHCSSNLDIKQNRKRSERIEAKKARKEQKRRKKEKKRERKTNRKSRKRKSTEGREDVDNSNASTGMPCISVPNSQVGTVPIVLAGVLQVDYQTDIVNQNLQLQDLTHQTPAIQNNVIGIARASFISSKNCESVQQSQSNTKAASCLLNRQSPQYEHNANNDKYQVLAIRSIGNTMIGATVSTNGTYSVAATAEKSEMQLNSNPEEVTTIASPDLTNQNSSSNFRPCPNQHDRNLRNINKDGTFCQSPIQDIDRITEAVANLEELTRAQSKIFPTVRNELSSSDGNINECHVIRHDQNDHNNPNEIEAIEALPLSSVTDMELQLLCAEHFLEDSSQAAAELSSGRWAGMYTTEGASEILNFVKCTGGKKFNLRDCGIVDDCGVDIELPGRVAIKVLWVQSPSKRRVFDSRAHARQLVQLASVGRYKVIHVIVVLDANEVNFNYCLDDFHTLQNSVVKQRGCLCQHIRFQYSDPSLLSVIIAKLALLNSRTENVTDIEFDCSSVEQASFLLGLMPSMSARECLSVVQQRLPFGQILLNAAHSSESTFMRNVSLLQLQKSVSTNIGSFGPT